MTPARKEITMTVKMITVHLFCEDWRTMQVHEEYRVENDLTLDEAMKWLDLLESGVQKGILKKYESKREIGFIQVVDCHREIHTRFPKNQGGKS